jgi:hypothetical protein
MAVLSVRELYAAIRVSVLKTLWRSDIVVGSGEGEGEYHGKEKDKSGLAQEGVGRVNTGDLIVATWGRENEKCLDCL